MRITLDLNPELLRQAMRETGAKSRAAVVQMGLAALLAIEARKRLKALFGQVPNLTSTRRR